MKRQWQPGDVALVQNEYGVWNRAILQVSPGGNRWVYGVSWSEMPEDAPASPMVVIDCGNVTQIEDLRSLVASQPMTQNISFDAMQAALREFANPTPRIEEPTGLGAVVETEDGDNYVKVALGPHGWVLANAMTRIDSGQGGRSWPQINAIRVLSPGVEVTQ